MVTLILRLQMLAEHVQEKRLIRCMSGQESALVCLVGRPTPSLPPLPRRCSSRAPPRRCSSRAPSRGAHRGARRARCLDGGRARLSFLGVSPPEPGARCGARRARLPPQRHPPPRHAPRRWPHQTGRHRPPPAAHSLHHGGGATGLDGGHDGVLLHASSQMSRAAWIDPVGYIYIVRGVVRS